MADIVVKLADQGAPDQNDQTIKPPEQKPVKLNLDHVNLSETIKTKIYAEYNHILRLLDFSNKAPDIFRRWYIDSKIYYNIVIDKELPQEGIKDIVPIDPLKIKKIRKVNKEIDKTSKDQVVSIVKNIEEYYVYTNTDKESYEIGRAHV